MNTKTRILCSVGTRPEAIKMAPVILALKREPWAEVRILATAQHRDLLDEIFRVFEIVPDVDLDIMQPDQTLVQLNSRLIPAIDRVLEAESPDIVLAQGDTTSVFLTALGCFYRKIPFGHVEAGLRTGERYYPFPEEMNRLLTTDLATFHFAPTEISRANLLKEGVTPSSIFVTGNSVIDAMYDALERSHELKPNITPGRRLILMTAHRRENFGPAFRQVCEGARAIVDAVEDTELLYPVHPNPNVQKVAKDVMSGHPRIRLTEPISYVPFLGLMNAAELILTDSGGIQEEAPALGKPVLVFRNETERPEAVDLGVVKLVGPDRERIFEEGVKLLTDPAYYKSMAKGVSPYGDGKAAQRIVNIIKESRTDRGLVPNPAWDEVRKKTNPDSAGSTI